MKVSSIENQLSRIYTGESGADSNTKVEKTRTETSEKLLNYKQKVEEPETILSKNEKNFFKKIFPENSESIERHVVFNRNGKVQKQNFALGTIFDGRF